MKIKLQGQKKNLFKELVEESLERKTKISGLRKNLIRQSNQLIDDALKGKYTLDKDELLKLSLPSFLKSSKQKDIKDIILISLYLVQMKKFMKLFGDDLKITKDNGFYEQLKKIESTIIYQNYNKNRLVIRYGEEGKKFFLLLKGEVQIILPNKKNVYISLKEFKRYLLLLFIYKEFEILRFVIKENRVNQRVGLFNTNYFFFPDEYWNNMNNNNLNNNISNSNKSSNNNINKNNDNYGNKNSNSNINKNKNKNTNKNNINNNSEEKTINMIKEIHKNSLNILMKFYLTEEEILFYEKTKDSEIKEVDDNYKLSPEDYINRLQNYSNFNFYKDEDDDDDENNVEEEEKNEEGEEEEEKIKKKKDFRKDLLTIKTRNYLDITNDDEKSNFNIYEYKKLIELQTGDMFGDLALSSNNAKRTATIITIEECHFACLTRALYSEFIEKGNERIRNNKVNYLCNINILKSFPRFILERKLFNHFAFKTFQKDKFILKTNEINNNIIFLKDGIFEVSFTGKLNDLGDLINFYYNQFLHIIKKKDNEENEDNFANNIKIMNFQKSKIERLFQKDINEEFSYILFLVNAPSIFGFRQTEKKKSKIVINNKENTTETINIFFSNFNVKCFSSKGEYIYIDKNMFYKHIYGMDGFVQEETKNCCIDFFRKTIKRLLNIRYIKIWNLFLANGVVKNLNLNIDWDKIENNDDIYTAVDKLLSILNEGQLYSNEMSKYINDYFEQKKQIIQNQKNKIKLFNQNYQSEKIKKLIILKTNKSNKTFRNLDYIKNNKIFLNNANGNNNNIYKNFLNNIISKNENNMEEKYKKIVKRILNMSQENLFRKEYYYTKKHKTRNTNRVISASSISKNKSLFVSKSGKNITINNYLLRLNREKSNPKENLSLISTAHSRKNGNLNDLKQFLAFGKNSENNLKKENKKSGDAYYFKIKKFNFLSKRPSTTKSFFSNYYIDYKKNNKEKYVKDRVRYIIKNTRILFTKTKNLDKIVRRRKNSSTL